MSSFRPAAVVIVAGFCLFVASFFAASLFGGSRGWSDAQAESYTRAAAAYHAAKLGAHSHAVGSPQHGHDSPASSVDEAESQFAAKQQELDAALNRGPRIAFWLRVVSVLCLAAGVVWYWRG